MLEFREIPGSDKWQDIQLITKGWSTDQKYKIRTTEGEDLLLRLSSLESLARKKEEFNHLKQIYNQGIHMNEPLAIGTCEEKQSSYMLFTWIEGEDAETEMANLDEKDQYRLGYEAGQLLRRIHQVKPVQQSEPWETYFNKKTDCKIDNYHKCPYKVDGGEKIIQYINRHRHLLKGRSKVVHHGDYHIGNLLITKDAHIGVIDFNRMDVGEPWEEFNRIPFCAHASPSFATGRINGYFQDKIPDDFFPLLAFYIGSNQLSSITWAVDFGDKEIKFMQNQMRRVLREYNDFKDYIPSWYLG